MAVLEATDGTTQKSEQLETTFAVAGKVRSMDGTAITFERRGCGSPVILVDGALCYRGMGQSGKLAELLEPHFTVFTYDRRGRGASGDTAPYSVEREVEDLAALVIEAGGNAYVWGMSSGGALALEAARRLSGIRKLGLYEVPFIVDNTRSSTEGDWERIGAAIAAGRRSEGVKLFLKSVGVPGFFRLLMPLMRPVWRKLKAVAHTLPYDGAIVSDNQRGKPLPADRWACVSAATLVMDGGKSPAWMRNGNQALAAILPNAQHRTLQGQTHLLKPKAHLPALVEFFRS
ncbi:MAG TPA: alpha/beta hydrolase [Steroidobacteraceae bacterium]